MFLAAIATVMLVGNASVQAQTPTQNFSAGAAGSTPLASDPGTSDSADAIAAQPDAFFEQYERQLNAILKTRRDEEKQFVKAVVDQVRAGNLTTRLVNTSFKWVRKKRPHIDYPFVYFQRVLRILAKQQRVESAVPPFDPSIYRRPEFSPSTITSPGRIGF